MNNRHFEGIRVFLINVDSFKKGAAFTFPGVGIFIGSNQISNENLLRHEFGHILQYRKKGFFYFWLIVAPKSIFSAINSSLNKQFQHKYTNVEIEANHFSYIYFENPEDWDFIHFPIKK